MSQIYKVFYKDRKVLLIDDFENTFQDHHGLYYKYQNKSQLSHLLDLFSRVKGIDQLFIYHPEIDFLFKEFSSLYKLIEAAGGIVKDPNNRTLFIKRKGKWDLPKGKLEKGESPESGALREVQEECGIEGVRTQQFLSISYHTYHLENQPVLKRTSWYEMHYSGDPHLTPQLEEDITEAIWVSQDQVHKIAENTYASLLDVMRKARLLKL